MFRSLFGGHFREFHEDALKSYHHFKWQTERIRPRSVNCWTELRIWHKNTLKALRSGGGSGDGVGGGGDGGGGGGGDGSGGGCTYTYTRIQWRCAVHVEPSFDSNCWLTQVFFSVILTLLTVGCERKVTALSARRIVIDCLKLCANSRLSSYQYFAFQKVPPTFAVGQATKRWLISFSWATLSNLHWLKLF